MWQATDSAVWQGRDDSRESPEALRVFQTVQQHSAWPTTLGKGDIALIGFASDTGVQRNQGRIGAAEAPPFAVVGDQLVHVGQTSEKLL